MRKSSHLSAEAGPSNVMEVDSPVEELPTIHVKHGQKRKRSGGQVVKKLDYSDEDSDEQLMKPKRMRKLIIEGNGRYYKPPCVHCVKEGVHCEQQEWSAWVCEVW